MSFELMAHSVTKVATEVLSNNGTVWTLVTITCQDYDGEHEIVFTLFHKDKDNTLPLLYPAIPQYAHLAAQEWPEHGK
jgi:hypothetical protein